jgi:hypothetical protein
MPTINQLTALNTLSAGDTFPVYSGQNGDARKVSISTLVDYLDTNYASPQFDTQYAAPTLTGFVTTLVQNNAPIWLILSPSGTMAAGTIVLPPVLGCFDGQEVLVFTSQAITALSVNGNGATAVNGAPTALTANSAFRLRFNALYTTWYIVSLPVSSTYYEANWTPHYNGSGLTGTVNLTGRYTQIGRQVFVELNIQPQSGSSLVFTYATDYFTGMPNALVPAVYAYGSGIDGSYIIGSNDGLGTFRVGLTKAPPNTQATFSAGGKYVYSFNYTL